MPLTLSENTPNFASAANNGCRANSIDLSCLPLAQHSADQRLARKLTRSSYKNAKAEQLTLLGEGEAA